LYAQDAPDHATIAQFRADCQDTFAELFVQVFFVAGKAGLARFGTVAIDGTKIAANASVHANRTVTGLPLRSPRSCPAAAQRRSPELSVD
jgi:hypothetical protein